MPADRTIRLTCRRAVEAGAGLALAAALATAAGCASSSTPPASSQVTTPERPTPMEVADAAPALRMAIGLRGDPQTMRFARDTPRMDMSLSEDGLTVWSVTGGVPVRFVHNRPECRDPTLSAPEFSSLTSQVLWSAAPRGFPDTGTWGFLGSRNDADAGTFGRSTFTYQSDGTVTLKLDVKDRPLSATTSRGPSRSASPATRSPRSAARRACRAAPDVRAPDARPAGARAVHLQLRRLEHERHAHGHQR